MMAVAHRQNAQRVLITRRRVGRAFPVGPTGRWTLAAVAALLVYRSIPATPDGELLTSVQQYLRFEYSERRAPEMEARANERASDALLAVTDDVLNARVEIDAITVRGPLLPSPLPRTAVVHVAYRIRKGREILAVEDRYLAFGRSLGSDWKFAGERGALLYWIVPA
jgi:hypothetical protein